MTRPYRKNTLFGGSGGLFFLFEVHQAEKQKDETEGSKADSEETITKPDEKESSDKSEETPSGKVEEN